MPLDSVAPVIAVDIGGTRTRIAVVRGGEVTRETYREIATRTFVSGEDLVQALCAEVLPLLGAHPVAGMGVSVPGLLTEGMSTVEGCPNTAVLERFPLRAKLAERVPLPLVLEVDCNAAAMAEYHFGGHGKPRRLMVISLGTGVGIGVVDGGVPLRIMGGCCGDLGHTHVGGELRCSAGCRGCLEANISVAALAGDAADPGNVVRQLIGRAQADDEIAMEVFRRAGDAIGIALASLSAFLRPDLVLLAGGISEASDCLLAAANRSFAAYGAREYFCPVRKGALGPDAALVGAAAALIHRWEES